MASPLDMLYRNVDRGRTMPGAMFPTPSVDFQTSPMPGSSMPGSSMPGSSMPMPQFGQGQGFGGQGFGGQGFGGQGFGGILPSMEDAAGPTTYSPSPDGDPIQLSGEDLRRFTFRFKYSLDNAISKMSKIHNEAEHDRKVYDTRPRAQEYEGQPNVTTPISANKADGVIANFRDAVEQRPLIAFNPEGVGSAAQEAAQIAPVLSAYFEREINRSGSREILTADVIREAVVVGTGIPRFSITQHENEEVFVQADIIRLENFFVDRISARSLADVFCAYRRKWRYYELQEMTDDGYLDPVALERVSKFTATGEEIISEEEDESFFEDTVLQEENTLHTVFVGYMRYRAGDDSRSIIYEAMYHKPSMSFLSIRKNPYGKALDVPPIGLARIGKRTGYLFGRGIIRRLHAEQQMADNAINNHLAINNLAANPPFLYRANSPFGRFLERNGRFGIRAGMGIPTYSSPDVGDVKNLEFRNPGYNIQDISIAQEFASQATYTEESIGSSSQGRRTLGQFQVEVQKGNIRIRLDLADIAYDYANIFTMAWAMVNAYKIDPQGIVEVTEKGKLLAGRTISKQETMQLIQEIVLPLAQNGTLQPDQTQDPKTGQPVGFQKYNEQINSLLTDGMIPSTRRSDLTISLAGTKIIADKVSELQMLMQLTPLITTLIPAAEKDSYFNYHLRTIIQTMGFKDVEKRMPSDPGTFISDATDRAKYAQPTNEMYARMSNQ